jgi:tetratricopeptide (TPR) repeat protein
MIRYKLIKGIGIVGGIVIGLSGCQLPEPSQVSPCEIDAALTDEGWDLYGRREYQGAVTKFDEALQQGCSTTDAYNGKGWAYAKMDSLSKAREQFTLSIQKGLSVVEAMVGRAAVNLELKVYREALQDAENALTLAPQYQFVRDRSVDYRDLYLIIAQAAYRLGNYRKAQEAVDLLDPSNGLDELKPSTWKVGGQSFKVYEEALLVKIESLDTS